jgi:hypothetical protein
MNGEKRLKRRAQINELIEGTVETGHECFEDEFEISLINNADLAISAQHISLERHIRPQEAVELLLPFYA